MSGGVDGIARLRKVYKEELRRGMRTDQLSNYNQSTLDYLILLSDSRFRTKRTSNMSPRIALNNIVRAVPRPQHMVMTQRSYSASTAPGPVSPACDSCGR
jgi:hypothetical protein